MNFDDIKVAIASATGIGNWMVSIDLVLKVAISLASLIYIILKIKELIKKEVDPELFDLSYDYVGDLAETIALIWPYKQKGKVPKLNFIIDELENSSTTNITKLIKKYLSIFSENERWAFIKLLSGGLRIGVSTRLTKLSLIHNTTIEISEIEQIWHGVVPPYNKLFNWIFGKGAKPEIEVEKVFHPLMLAHPIEKKDFNNLNPTEFFAEWKWDGIRVQLVLFKSKIRIFSRTGDDISNTFPEIQNNENDLVNDSSHKNLNEDIKMAI